MKKKFYVTLIVMMLVLGMAGCQETTKTEIPTATEATEPTIAPTPTPEPTMTPEPIATPEPTMAPEPTATPEPTVTPLPTATPTPQPTPTPSLEELWEAKYEAGELPKAAWIDELYQMLNTGDYKGVIKVLKDDSIAEKVKPYLYYEYIYDASAYKMVTSDGEIIGIHLPNDISSGGERHAWYAPSEFDHGFYDTGYGDKEVVYYPEPYADWDYIWFDGEAARYSNGDVDWYDEDQCFSIWEF